MLSLSRTDIHIFNHIALNGKGKKKPNNTS
jgi:hypothetical protein